MPNLLDVGSCHLHDFRGICWSAVWEPETDLLQGLLGRVFSNCLEHRKTVMSMGRMCNLSK